MRLISAGLILGLLAGLAQAKELSPREIYEQTSPAVVMVMGHPESGKSGSGGTGSIIQADGLVLTNAHVVIEEKTGKPYPRLSVFLKPGRVTGDTKVDLSRMAKARVLAYSSPLDLALLKLEGVRGPFPVIDLSDSERTRIGDRVIAIGHPEQGGLWTLTTGVISAEVDNFNGVKGKHVFQTETGLNRGNSGGPLVDSEGRMVGVNTAIARVAPDGLPITSISFSLKSTVARQWLSEQGVTGTASAAQAASSSTKAAAETPPPVSTAPSTSAPQATTSPKPGTTMGPSVKPAPTEPPMPARPYNLDQLLSERSKAEADLENMITEMRGKMKGR
ncbi:S1C family serine protease [Nitrospira moscoviensis]|uniref:Trypsin-like serine protease n=1 Tax=Nitrospira moscoviensis TaxID=42253 RepID=A0A0K2GHP7_NITMO|nr:serine protease [Nitrospira moscoviensis]ALA60157.1 Trypsin-like serine protease [Nitrospira moscoviensis]